jgi:pyruvate carboxylase subunit B
MPGMIIRFEVEVGASVKEGDVVLVLEAMKMENSITSPVSGTVKQIGFKDGDSVQKGDVLVVIG